ncbi:capsular biosynthesis protein [Helicobacter sp. CLO-3]|uniref:glycosyltransferase family 2 protein n=1 Tax=unclassified Helicobacter TaxID=2593540 RepID=UPI0008050C5D|nr:MULTISPECIES: glycosyltransferase family 2 protein [unclassified Helicobacter]OBV28940.1 capsular biosynthesis protein [Helicobacter sp. CLO-3]OHU81556.1 capsular biosynthesis protein [Helicobacter sp. CLO-3]
MQNNTSQNHPLISIIIPVYNVEQYIARCLESCINQTFSDIEILIVDDCGSDDSLQIAQGFADKDPRIRIIHNAQNLGTFHVRAAGISQARAPYCMFADPDDFFAPNACEIAYNAIKTHNVDMVQFGINCHPKTIRRIRPVVHSGFLRDKEMRLFLSAKNNMQGLWDKIIRTPILQKSLESLAFMDSPLLMLEDGLLVLVASFEAHSYYGINDILYYYCDNPISITKDKSVANLHKKRANMCYLLEITQRLKDIYQAQIDIIEAYRRKIASTLIIESRPHDEFELCESMLMLRDFGFSKKSCPSTYIRSVVLSMRYAFRWQNLVRLVAYIASFGKVKL